MRALRPLIRRRARAAGKQKDDDWIMDLVFSCFTGAAVRWESTLSPEIKRSWDRFRQALLDRYPSDSEPRLSLSRSSTIPTPAAAAAVAAAIAGPVARDPQPALTRALSGLNFGELTGRVAVVSENSRARRYVSRYLEGSESSFSVSDDRSNALLVRFTPLSESYAIEMLNCASSYQWLALQKASNTTFGPESDQWARLCGINYAGRGELISSLQSSYVLGDMRRSIWKLAHEGTLLAIWNEEGCDYVLHGCRRPFTKAGIVFYCDWSTFVRSQSKTRNEGKPHVQLRLVFEPL